MLPWHASNGQLLRFLSTVHVYASVRAGVPQRIMHQHGPLLVPRGQWMCVRIGHHPGHQRLRRHWCAPLFRVSKKR